ncbi:MAG TPA: hypothetical protein VFW90_03100 [Candidatus Saccharimonadales bacterium]|nr:hypothetical protein [Candidatus Saccharimonadales bacterium]
MVVGSSPANQNRLTATKDKIVAQLIIKYLGSRRRAGNSFYVRAEENWENDLFQNSKFGGYTKQRYAIKISRTVDQIIGELYSMSWARRVVFW